MADSPLSIPLSTPLRAGLDSLALTSGKSETELVLQAVEEFLDRQGALLSCYDLAVKTGLLGCGSGGPPDLSTNPKYMEGFGRD